MLTLAPLHGVTNRFFRAAFFYRFPGFDRAVAPFVSATRTEKARSRHYDDLLPEHNAQLPVQPQLLTADAAAFLASAASLAELGYASVDWNLGCPYPMVADKGRGCGLMPFPEKVDAFLAKVVPACPLAVSVKLRLGRYAASELDALVPVLNSHRLLRVTVHPRLGTQLYEGRADVEGFARVLPLLEAEVSYNGDIADASGFAALKSRFPSVRDWMIGRGALADPFLPGTLKGLALPGNPLAALKDFHDDLYWSYADAFDGPRHALDKMKEVWGCLGPSFAGGADALRRISKSKASGEYEDAVKALFAASSWAPRGEASRP